MYSIRDVNKNKKYGKLLDTHSNKKVIRHNMNGIKFINHILVTYESNKIFLTAFDDKRYILDDGINALLYGHKDIPK